ncbi:MAG: mevalonate kinase [Acidobacteriota bacterium]
MRCLCSAPGKTILMGEHAAVYGRPALVAAVDRRLKAELRARDRGRVRLRLPAIGVDEDIPWDAIQDYASRARRRWRAYVEQPDPEGFDRLLGDDPAHLVKVALGEAYELVGESSRGIEILLDSKIPIGAGFGSSAAVSAAILGGFLALHGVEISAQELEHASLEVERRQHGLPSGIDTKTVIRGGLIWAKRDGSGELSAVDVDLHRASLNEVRIFNSGTPAQSTGEVVAEVRSLRDADPRRFEAILDRMEEATRELRRLLERPSPQELGEPIRVFEGCLEEIGVVPPRLRKIVREVEAAGGAAKISGAGALAGEGAGSLLVYHPDPARLEGCSALAELEALEVSLGGPGLRVEERVG